MRLKNNLYKSLLLFTLFFVGPLLIHAAGIELTPTNLPEVVDKVFYLHDDEIVVTDWVVKNFLDANIQGNFDDNLKTIEPTITKVSTDAIRFEWPVIDDATEYIIRYLNLNNGHHEKYLTTSTFINLSIPNELFLFTFQIKDSAGSFSKSKVITESKGTNFIIIEDRPLSLVLNEDCDCRNPGEIFSEQILDDIVLIPPFPSGNANKTYNVQVESIDPSETLHTSNYYIQFNTNEELPTEVGVPNPNFGCNLNMDIFDIELSYLYALNTSISEDEIEQRIVRFSFNGGLQVYNLDHSLYQTTVTVVECLEVESEGKLTKRESSEFPMAIISPNPSQNLITLDYQKPGNIPDKIQIINNYGQVVNEISAFQVKVKIDIDELPAGVYHVRSISEKKFTTSTFVKL